MKKTLLKGITLLALLGSSVTGVFAEEGTSLAQTGNKITFNKKYVAEGETAKAPAEVFEFTISPVSVTDSTVTEVPTATIGTTSFDPSDPKDTLPVSITLPEYEAVGVYTYKIEETAGTTAGVTYDNKPANLRVYVTQNDDGSFSTKYVIYPEGIDMNVGKTDTPFKNKYEAGSLEVKKEVKGNLGERDREFPITITLNAPDRLNVTSKILVDDDEDKQITFVEGVATINEKIKHGQTIKLSNLPKGTTYTILETKPEDYQTPLITINDEEKIVNTKIEGSIEASEADKITFTNTKEQLIPTGVIIENLPYIVLLVLAIAGLGFFLFKKRQNNHLN